MMCERLLPSATILVLIEEVDMIALTQALQIAACAVVGMRRREHALALLKDVPIKLIILDLTLSGVEFIRRACRARNDVRSFS